MAEQITTPDDAALSGELKRRLEGTELPRYVVVEGAIGVGKTTLARKLAATFSYPLMLEPVSDNPFLERFYRDRQANALPTQLFFLLHRARQIQELPGNDLLGPTLVADFLMAKDELFARLTLDAQEFELYRQIYDQLDVRAPIPDLVIYLQAPMNVLMQRIRERGNQYEQHIEMNYLEALHRAYTEYFHFYDAAPLLIVNAASIDFAHNYRHFEALVTQILDMDGTRMYFNPHPTLL